MTIYYIQPEQLFDGEQFIKHPIVAIEKGIIVEIYASAEAIPTFTTKNINVNHIEGIIAPSYIDIQVNGGGGYLFNNQPSTDTLYSMAKAHQKYGTTHFLPTLITDELAVMQQGADAVATVLKNADSSVNADYKSGVIGIHFEGPHLSLPKKGVHPKRYVRALTDAEMQIYERTDIGIKLLTVAPETVSAAQIKRLIAADVIVCLGHSNADYETCIKAIDAGATGVTHLYNAMSPTTGRAPGLVGAALMDDRVACGIIFDNHHVHVANIKLACRNKPVDKMILVTDAMALVGSNQTEFNLFGETIYLKKDKLTTADGTLAGAHLTMQQALENAMTQLNLPPEQVFNMASLNAAKLVKSKNIGRLKVGCPANFVQLTPNYQLVSTWVNGQCVYPSCLKMHVSELSQHF